jgi:hypothetical protein
MARLASMMAIGLLTAGVGVARAEDCFGGGFSCETAAAGSTSFKLARDCPAVFQVAPDKADEFKKLVFVLRHRPMAYMWPEEFSDTPQPRSEKECRHAALAAMHGKVPGLYVSVRPEVAKSLGR